MSSPSRAGSLPRRVLPRVCLPPQRYVAREPQPPGDVRTCVFTDAPVCGTAMLLTRPLFMRSPIKDALL